MKRILPFSALATMVGMLGSASVALAAPPVLAPELPLPPFRELPQACGGPRDTSQFLTGYVLGYRAARQVVEGVGDCSQIGELAGAVRERVAAFVGNIADFTGPVSARSSCRRAGFLDAFLAEIDNQSTMCGEASCAAGGELFGELAAQVYCMAAPTFGGLELPLQRQPLNPCGVDYSLACSRAFEGVSVVADFGPVLGGACLPFTEGPFADAWEESRANQCELELPANPE